MILPRALLLATALLFAAPPLEAQRPAPASALKRALPAIAPGNACPAAPRAAAPTAARRRQARELAQRAQQSAILGDRNAARDQLRQAALLDPADADVAYQLARAYEGGSSDADALREYCRFLALAPSAPEASEARERVQALAPAALAASPSPAVVAFRTGITAYERAQFAAAEAAFTRAIAEMPQWPEPYYDRGLARMARGARDLAVRDLEQYLRLRPEAEDRPAIVARIASLRNVTPLSPGSAFALGVVIPGGGQFYTGRKLFGAVTLSAAAGAGAWAFQTGKVTRTTLQTATDPFGNSYSFPVTRVEDGRPNLTTGVAIAGGIAAAAALESFYYARRVNAGNRRVSASLLPTGRSLALTLTVR